jgi:hypothetical protein
MTLWVRYEKKIESELFFSSLKLLKKGVGSVVGSGFTSHGSVTLVLGFFQLFQDVATLSKDSHSESGSFKASRIRLRNQQTLISTAL